ncbi:hypothetical protein G0Q06_07445 [Puniceicoccales bacterium CK1056]|uniref:Fibronectin type-III domain-containing protein n=1 Tax=Oceanipulchritudo coccoides TaxID=2706888 RepID=A0A6B2M2H1_9BACT|nr:hypothetical protein [Oceanipulchritudo coccoides]NDV62277.1 hypothetical protein [Oceanipulchritudo coccoides]
MRNLPGTFILFLGSLSALLGQTTILPEVLDLSQTTEKPYSYNGYLGVGSTNGFASGSASMVENGVIVTAAHVIFDDVNLVWEPSNAISYYPQRHTPNGSPVLTGSFKPEAFSRWTSYATRVENDPSGIGLSSPDTFNIDFAAGYISPFIKLASLRSFPEVHVDAEETVSILRDNREKMIVGYPADTDFIPESNIGLMHRTEPGDYFSFWSGLESRPDDTWRDSENFWVATYGFENVNTHSGNSGGPIYVRDDENAWVVAGVVVGSVGSTGVLIRGIDENAWQWIEESIVARGTSDLRRVTNLTAEQTSSTTILLQWEDNSEGETGYKIYRLDGGFWEAIATVPADREAYGDVNIIPGQVYRYKVQTIGTGSALTPKSKPVTVVTTGRSTVAATHFDQPWLGFVTEGDSNWFVDDGNRLRAGKVRSLGQSSLRLDIIGPGTLDFSWSVSSEVNQEYNTPGPTFGEIYDAVYLHLNGNPVMEGQTPVFLSGFIGPTARQMVLPAGAHTIEWIYEKDPYSTEGEDTAFLDSLLWTPDPANPYPVQGGFAMEDPGWHSSTWFGPYVATGTPWVSHSELGWLYLRPGNGEDLYFHSILPELGDLYTNSAVFPYVYHINRGVWLFYFESSGDFGERLWFYDQELSIPVRVN